jgi:uncharacterized protein (DUF433 family)
MASHASAHTRDNALIAAHIEQHPRRPGLDEARLIGFCVPVWALVGYSFAVNGDIERIAADYDVPVDAVAAALAYYRRHRALIDARLAANATPIA